MPRPPLPQALAALARCPALDAVRLRAALAGLGTDDVAALYGTSPRQLQAVGLPEAAAVTFAAGPPVAAAQDADWAGDAGVTLLCCTDPRFPTQLAAIPGCPPLLYVRGDPALLRTPQLAIIGSRQPTAMGARTAADFAAAFAAAGFAVTSGLARGIDAAAHRGALQAGGVTIAVLGTGPDVTYPPEHGPLAAEIAAAGAVITEFPPGTPPLRHNFPQRNRLVSGLARGLLVVEAARRSGTFGTAKHALDQGRDVFAVPGSIHNPQASGCLQLLREGAQLVTCPADVLAEARIPIEKPHINQGLIKAEIRGSAAPRLDKVAEMLLDALGFEPAGIDELVERTGLAPAAIAAILPVLELEGRVETWPGARYNRIAAPTTGSGPTE